MFNKYGRQAYIEQLLKMIAYRNDGLGNPHPFGDDLAEGFVRAAEKWGRLDGDEGDLKTGRLKFPNWGLPQHKEPRSQLDWAYGSILGKKIWNLDHAVWTLQGRHRDMVHFSDYLYTQPGIVDQYLPGRKNGKWDYINTRGRHFERDKFDEFKTRFYKLQGWDTSTGYTTRGTLESLDLGYVADELKKSDRLGKG